MVAFAHTTLRQRIYDELVDLLVSGELVMGEQVDEQGIADRLAVSRTPLREAMGKLVKDGLLEYRPYRGNFVRAFTAKEIDGLYEVRKSLESLAVRLATPRLTKSGLKRIGAVLAAAVAALERGDLRAYAMHDRRFHEQMAALADNGTLVETLNRLSLQIQLCRVIANGEPGVVERTARERQALLEALAARDGERAAAIMEQHIEGVRRAVRAKLASDEEAAARAGGDGVPAERRSRRRQGPRRAAAPMLKAG